MADYVLVHGTTQAPSGWNRLVEELEHRGHHAHPVDLDSERTDLATSDLAQLAHDQLPPSVTEPLIVAHSGSGLVLPAVAEATGAAHQVWLAATVPDPAGQHSLVDEIQPDPAAVFNPEWVGADPTSDPVLATYFLFHDCDLATLRWALTTLRLFSAISGAYRELPVPDLVHQRPSTYLLPRDDRTLRPEHMRRLARARLVIEPVEIPGGHCPHVAQPAGLAQLLDDLSR